MNFESGSAGIVINYEPSEEDIRTQRLNWNGLKIGEEWVTGFGTFEKTKKGYKLMTVRSTIPNRHIAEFILRCALVCEACGYELDTKIYEV